MISVYCAHYVLWYGLTVCYFETEKTKLIKGSGAVQWSREQHSVVAGRRRRSQWIRVGLGWGGGGAKLGKYHDDNL